jgi:hypothetical protein
MTDLSMDARVLLTAWFLNGHHTMVEVGGATAKSRLTDRARAALAELEASGHITAKPVGKEGRMLFQGTDIRDGRLSLAEIEKHGAWSPTEPNPGASEHNRAKSTATLRLTSGGQP